MARTGSLIILISLLLLSFTITTLLTLALATNIRESHSLVTTKLIHRESIDSPSYNPNDTIEDRAKRMIKASNARFNFLQKKTKRRSLLPAVDYNDEGDTSDTYEADLLHDYYIFMVNFSIGQPPTPQFAIMDTGSDLIWVQCEPCEKCYKQQGPMYDSLRSSAYVDLSCSDPECYDPTCDDVDEDICLYNVTYGDNSTSVGIIGKDQFLFQTPDDRIIILHDVMFGCGQSNTRVTNGVIYLQSGVFGLGIETFLIKKIGFGFSYCIGNISDPLYNFNRLTLGSKLKAEGYSTPLTALSGHYYVNLEGISIGQEKLDINPRVFERLDFDGSYKSNVIIDSGATLTRIPREAYDVVRTKVSSLLDGFLERLEFPGDQNERHLCYIGNLNRDLRGFPVATLHLEHGADLVLEIGSLFFQITTNSVCLALVPPVTPNDLCIIGILAQQYYNVAFDLNQKMLYLQRIECELLVE